MISILSIPGVSISVLKVQWFKLFQKVFLKVKYFRGSSQFSIVTIIGKNITPLET